MGGDDDLVKKAKDESNKDIVLKRASLGEVKKLIVFGGKIDSDKTQVLELIKAVGNLKDEGVGLLLFGSVSPDLKDLFDSLVGGYANVSYIGWVRSEASYELFEVADLVCFPGRHSVFWEQAAAQGKPLLLKQWPSYEHIDRFGNVAYTEGDTAEEIEKSIRMVFSNGRMEQMKCAAESSARYFLYSAIAKRSLMLD